MTTVTLVSSRRALDDMGEGSRCHGDRRSVSRTGVDGAIIERFETLNAVASPISTLDQRAKGPAAAAKLPKSAGAAALLCFDARSNGGNDGGCHLELLLTAVDSMPSCDPVEISVGGPDLALLVLVDEQSYRPVKPGI